MELRGFGSRQLGRFFAVPTRSYEADGIIVHWDAERCVHSAVCLRSLPGVFDLDQRPWVDLEAATPDEVAALIETCPSGALRYERTDGTAGEQAPETTTVIPWPNGPLIVRGSLTVQDRRGGVFDAGPRFALCRCGASENQPFCDMSHLRVEFRDNPRAVDDRAAARNPGDLSPDPGLA